MLKQSGQKIIEDILESDDEVPDDYIEDADIPVYQNNMRFDAIKYSWIDSNFSKYYSRKNNEKRFCLSSLYSSLNEDIVHKKTENLKMGQKSLIFAGVLSQQDVFCIKSVEPIASDATLLWFINFLIYKDLQSDYSFLKACLVDAICKKLSNPTANLNYSESKTYNFDIITKE